MSTSNLPKILRNSGAMVLIASGVIFMLEGWASLTSNMKFLAFMGLTLTLGLAGVFCSQVLKENKGARTLLALATATTAVHFSQLGAMLLSLVRPPSANLPSFLICRAESIPFLLLLVLLSTLVLMPLSYLGFSALYRGPASRLTVLFGLLNGLLLIPNRNGALALAMTAGSVALLLYQERRIPDHDPASKTLEAWIARTILASPVLILVCRALFYPMSDRVLGLFFLLASACLFLLLPQTPLSKKTASTFQGLSILPLALGWFLLFGFPTLELNWAMFPLCWSLMGMSLGAISHSKVFRDLSVGVALIGSLSAVLGFPDGLMAAVMVLNGILIASVGVAIRERSPLTGGAISTALGLIYCIRLAFDHFSFNPWLVLAAIGLFTLLLSSYLEKNQLRITTLWSLPRRENGRSK